jgi:protein-S-isoprenylcysteine O-methyltransferase Ste14
MTEATQTPTGREPKHSHPAKVFAFLYGAAVYLGVWIILSYVISFVGNYFGPVINSEWGDVLPLKSIDMGIEEPFWTAVIIDVLLLLVLGLQHSIMPRTFFKRAITRIVPVHLERSTYIIFAIAALSLLMWQWRPIDDVIWHVENQALRVILSLISFGGWVTVLVATAYVGHWKIFGVEQTIDFIEDDDYTFDTHERLSPAYYEAGWPMTAKGPWNLSRHPDFFGFIVAFWVTPTMTAGHLLFAVSLTIYILIGIFLLERNLTDLYGVEYSSYVTGRSRVIPWFTRRPGSAPGS